MRYPFPMVVYYAWRKFGALFPRWFCKLRAKAIFWFWNVDCKGKFCVSGGLFIRTDRGGQIKIGRRVRFNAAKTENPLCKGLNTIDARGGYVEIGDGTGMSSVTISSRSSVKVGDRCLIGANTQIFDHNFHALGANERNNPKLQHEIKSAAVVIGDDCFIGANTIILKGTSIGARSLISAGSVIFGLDIPPDSLVRGNPAVILENKRTKL